MNKELLAQNWFTPKKSSPENSSTLKEFSGEEFLGGKPKIDN